MKKRILSLLLLSLLLLSSCTAVPTDTQQQTDGQTQSTEPITSDTKKETEPETPPENTPSEAELESLYKTAGEAASAKSYQYAYGLYAKLSYYSYKDSADKASALIRDAYATPVTFVSKDAVAQLRNTEVSGGGGYLYISSDGTVKYTYATEDGTVHTITPDSSLTGIRSIVYANSICYGAADICIFLKTDGTLTYLYDSEGLSQKIEGYKNGTLPDKDGVYLGQAQSAKEEIEKLIPYLSEQKDIVRVAVYETYSLHLACLSADGSLSTNTEALAKITEWKNVIDISITYNSAKAINKDFDLLMLNGGVLTSGKSTIHLFNNGAMPDGWVFSPGSDIVICADGSVKSTVSFAADKKASELSCITATCFTESGYDNGRFAVGTNGRVAAIIPPGRSGTFTHSDKVGAALMSAELYIG